MAVNNNNNEIAELDQIYTNPSSPASFQGIDSVYGEAKLRGLNVTRRRVRQYLQSQRSYTRHGTIRVRFPRNPIWSYSVNDCWFADLHDMTRLNWQNRRKKFLLIVVDALSRYLYCEPVRNKTADAVLEAMKKVVAKAGTSPTRITVDAGSEFINTKMKQYLEREGVRIQIARAPLKASLAELMGKLLKQKIFRYMTHNRTKRYIDRLPEFVLSLNSRRLKSLGGISPKDVNYQNQAEVYEAQLGKYRIRNAGKNRLQPDFKFAIGDRVRLAHKKDCFVKGYVPSYSEEIYVIRDRKAVFPQPLYKLNDSLANPITGRYYAEELCKVA